MMDMRAFLCGAIVIEALISWSNTIVKDHKLQWQIIVAFILGLLLTFDLKLNMFDLLGLEEQTAWVGYVVTAVALSRGSNYCYELYTALANTSDKLAK